MQHQSLVITISLALAACATTTEQPQLSAADQKELAALGVASVERDGDTFLLADAEGHDVGAVQLDESSVDATLGADRVTSHADAAGRALSCDGSALAIPRTSSVSADAVAPIAPCASALRVAGILAGDPPAPTTAFLGGACQFLGANRYCQGDVQVTNYDTLCVDQVGFYYMETLTTYTPGSLYCR